MVGFVGEIVVFDKLAKHLSGKCNDRTSYITSFKSCFTSKNGAE